MMTCPLKKDWKIGGENVKTTPVTNKVLSISSTLFAIGTISLVAKAFYDWKLLIPVTVVCYGLAYTSLYGGVKYRGL